MAKSFSSHSAVVKMMHQRLLAAVDKEIAKGIKPADPLPPGKCSPAEMKATVCDYLTRKQTNMGHFRGLPDTILSGVGYMLPKKLAAYYAKGAVEAAKHVKFQVVEAAMDAEFDDH